MPRDYTIYIRDILEAVANIEEDTNDMTAAKLKTDRRRRDAIIRNLVVIGEAVKNVPVELRDKEPKVDWQGLSGLRDILIHQHFSTDLNKVWEVIEDDIPKLKQAAKRLLDKI